MKDGDWNGALKYANQSELLGPQFPDAHRLKGYIFLYQKKLDNAILEFKNALSKDKGDIYRVMWLYITAHQNANEGLATIQPYIKGLNKKEWPYPLLQLLTEEINSRTLIEEWGERVSADLHI